MSTKVRVTRQDFRKAAKVCKIKGHSICRCVVAAAIERSGVFNVVGGVGYTQCHGFDTQNNRIVMDDITNNMHKVVNIFDDNYDDKPADFMYKEAQSKGVLELELVPNKAIPS